MSGNDELQLPDKDDVVRTKVEWGDLLARAFEQEDKNLAFAESQPPGASNTYPEKPLGLKGPKIKNEKDSNGGSGEQWPSLGPAEKGGSNIPSARPAKRPRVTVEEVPDEDCVPRPAHSSEAAEGETKKKRKTKGNAAERQRRHRQKEAQEKKARTENPPTTGIRPPGFDHTIPKLRDKFKKFLVLRLKTALGSDVTAAKGCWQGVLKSNGLGCPSLRQLIEEGVEILDWDGRTPVLVLDMNDRIIAVLVGRPHEDPGAPPDPNRPPWADSTRGAEAAMKRCQAAMNWADNQCLPKPPGKGNTENRRGDYPTFNAGISMGCGSQWPGFFAHTPHNQKCVNEYLADPSIRRLMAFVNAVFAYYMPKLWSHYRETMSELCLQEDGPGYDPPFHDTVFSAHSANLGPAAYAYLHEDFLNLAFGVCGLQALGEFDHTQGGHLYFPQLGFATQFPSGSTILLPSAAITHGNVPVGPTERRSSLVHYTPAGIFRWVKYGFMTMTDCEIDDPDLYKKLQGENSQRVTEALGMFSTLESLSRDQAEVFPRRS